MEQEKTTAIILGATGLVGRQLLTKLLYDEQYQEVKVFTRRPVGIFHAKLKEFVGDLLELEKFQEEFKGDVVFVCVGTTKKKTPDKQVYRKIDYGIPVTAARLAAQNGIHKFLVISALGVKPNSKIFYNATKGQMEEAVLEAGIPRTFIFKPSLITGNREEVRPGEAVGEKLMNIINPFLFGSWKKFRSIEATIIARAMHYVARHGYYKKRIPSDEIQELVEHYENIDNNQ